MRLLYIDYNLFGKEDIIDAFTKLGYEVSVTECPLVFGEFSEKTCEELKHIIAQGEFDAVFTSNYYPIVSDICMECNVKYISWTYDSPRIALYDRTINNSCNYAFVFDSEECMRLRKKGADRVYYMPLGVNVGRVGVIDISDEDRQHFTSDVSIVASLYNEEHNLYDRMYELLDDYSRGYLDAIIGAQRRIYGGCIIDESLSDGIIDIMRKTMPYEPDKGSLADYRYIYANYFLARKVATYQRKDMIKAISEQYMIKVYTPGNIDDIPKAIHMGTVDYKTDMNKVFKLSRINLNITLPSIRTGIPLRALDIMGAGGFLLTDYRVDFSGVLDPNEDFVYYTSVSDAISKIEYYLKHEDERKEIAANGKRKIEECFSYESRIRDMLDIVAN